MSNFNKYCSYITLLSMMLLISSNAFTFPYSQRENQNDSTKQNTLSARFKCLDKLEFEISQDTLYSHVRNLFLDTLADWKRKRLSCINFGNLDIESVDNRICFNTSYDKCLLFLLKKDPDRSAKMNAIDFILGVFENDKWNFYSAGINGFALAKTYLKKTFPRARDMRNNVNFGSLNQCLRLIIAQNYYKDSNCTINDKFINSEFDEYTKLHHEQFLQKKGAYGTEYEEAELTKIKKRTSKK